MLIWPHDKDVAAATQRGHRGEVLDRVVRQLLEQVLVRRLCGVGRDEDGMAVGRRLGDELRGDKAVRARLVVHDDRLLGFVADFLTESPCELIGGAPRGEWHHEADDFAGIALRVRQSSNCAEKGRSENAREGHEIILGVENTLPIPVFFI